MNTSKTDNLKAFALRPFTLIVCWSSESIRILDNAGQSSDDLQNSSTVSEMFG